jgi:uncharacterized membrane protein
LRGGNWVDNSSNLESSSRINVNPTDGSLLIGFRVASVPEPGSIILVVGGAIAVLIWFRRRS